MKIKITMKDPDGVYESVSAAADESVAGIAGLDNAERAALAEKRHDAISEGIGQWVQWGEYVTIEIDTDAGTATVVPVA